MIEPGGVYYIMTHAYYHYVAEVTAVYPQRVDVGRCVQVHSDPRGWTRFFAEGWSAQTRFDEMPEGGDLAKLNAFPWRHGFPGEKHEARRRG